MRLVMVVVVAVGVSRAYAAPAEIMVDQSWTSEPAPENILAALKRTENARRADGRVWYFEGGKLLLLDLEVEAVGTTHRTVEGIEKATEDGLVSRAGGSAAVVSKTRRTENNRLIIDQVLGGDAHVHMRRIYAANRDDIVRAVFATCGSIAAAPKCDAALDTIRIPGNAVPIEDNRVRAIAFRVGELVGFGLIIAFVGWLITRASRKKKGAALPKERVL